MAEIELELFKHALTTARKHKMAEVELEVGGARFAAVLEPRKGHKGEKAAAEPEVAEVFETVTSTFVGYYGLPDLLVGAAVKKGDVVGTISTLGIANELESPVDGEIVEFLATEGESVEFGQPLVRIKL